MRKVIKYGSISSYKNLEIHFKEMAGKGHMIGFISTSEYFFDEIKPRDLDFKVTIFNKYDLSIYGDREKYIKEMKKNNWKFVLKNDKMIIFCRNSTDDTSNNLENDRQQYKMVKSVWNRNFSKKNIRLALIGLVLFGIRIYDFQFPVVYFSNNFMKIFAPLMTLLILTPVLGKTPYWLYKNKMNIMKGKKLYHRKKSTDKFLDLYMYIGAPIIIIFKWLIILGAKDNKAIVVMSLVYALPWIGFIFFQKSNFYCSIKSKFIKYAICFASFIIWFFLLAATGFYMAMLKSGTI